MPDEPCLVNLLLPLEIFAEAGCRVILYLIFSEHLSVQLEAELVGREYEQTVSFNFFHGFANQ